MSKRLALLLVAMIVLGAGAAAFWLPSDGGTGNVLGVWGAAGTRPGEFILPRAMALGENTLFVVDKRARIQRFSLDGRYETEWQTPVFDNGKPTGLAVVLDGNLLVADTHYSRILRYSPDGTLLASFGSEGEGPGQFIYPTDVAQDRDGYLYVCEYGGNERIQKFTNNGEPLLSWGRRGEGIGEFIRPMAIAVGPDGLIYVADACNHRVQVFERDGTFVRAWGQVGGGPGEMRYPYDLVVTDQHVLVCEYGNNRLQRFDLLGRSLGMWGSPGQATGQLQTPWALAMGRGGQVYVADTGNHRIQVAKF